MISYKHSCAPTVVSDRIFRPTDTGNLIAEWGDPSGVNTPSDSIIDQHSALRALIARDRTHHLTASDAIQARTYRVAAYQGLGSSESVEDTAQDLRWFAEQADSIHPTHAVLFAFFDDPTISDQRDFEHQLWSQLIGMHNIDTRNRGWAPSVKCDPDDEDLSFSIAGQAFDIIGLHPHADEPSRRFEIPTLIFTPQVTAISDGLRTRIRTTHRAPATTTSERHSNHAAPSFAHI